MLRFDAITLFPEMFAAVTQSGITRRALERGLWRLELLESARFRRQTSTGRSMTGRTAAGRAW